jgi:hypothetical protein
MLLLWRSVEARGKVCFAAVAKSHADRLARRRGSNAGCAAWVRHDEAAFAEPQHAQGEPGATPAAR